MNITAPLLHLDQLKDGDHAPTGPLVLRGWIADEGLRPFADLRITSNDRTTLAVLGFPRTDIASHFNLADPFFPGGFEAVVSVTTGHQVFHFEVQHSSGQWIVIGQLALHGEPGESPASTPTELPEVQPHVFGHALKLALRHAAKLSHQAAVETVVSSIPKPAILRHAEAPLHGHLHQPARLERAQFGRIRISGWMFHETLPIKRIIASLDLQVWQDLRLGGEIPYVTAMFPSFANAKDSAFRGLIDTPAQFASPLCIRIIAQLEDGSWHLAQVIRTLTWEIELEKSGYAPFARSTFLQTTLKLRQSLKRAGFSLPSGRLQWETIRSIFREYRDGAPRVKISGATTVSPNPTGTLPSPTPPPRKVTLITHNLNLEGAPLFLWELAQHLIAQGTAIQVISAQDGPLAAKYEGLGAAITFVNIEALSKASSSRELARDIVQLSGSIDLTECDLVIANTLSCYWGVHLASRAKTPSLFYIHESTTPTSFYYGHMDPATLPLIQSTFQLASHVSFLTEATRAYYRPWLGSDNHSINPGWIDVGVIDEFLAKNSRDALRRKLGLPQDKKIVINVGSICDRKGQHIFIRGVDLLARFDTALVPECLFLMIGGRDTLFDNDIKSLLRNADRSNLKIIPETQTPLDYYGAADLFVCTSYEESFPRVIMEAMACRLPILSTDVHGIPHMLDREKEGRLFPPGNTAALCDNLSKILTNPELAQTMAERARQRVTEQFDSKVLLPQHAALIASLAKFLK